MMTDGGTDAVLFVFAGILHFQFRFVRFEFGPIEFAIAVGIGFGVLAEVLVLPVLRIFNDRR